MSMKGPRLTHAHIVDHRHLRARRLARSRRSELTDRIEQLRDLEHSANRDADGLARQAADLHRQTGPREQREQITARTLRAETDYPHARDAAQARDLVAADTAARRAADLAVQRDHRAYELDQLRTENDLRDRLPADVRQREDHERDHAPADPAPQPTSPEQPAPTPAPELISHELGNPQPIGPEPGGAEPTGPETLHLGLPEPDIEHTVPPPDTGEPER